MDASAVVTLIQRCFDVQELKILERASRLLQWMKASFLPHDSDGSFFDLGVPGAWKLKEFAVNSLMSSFIRNHL
jgi:hypothetical protein